MSSDPTTTNPNGDGFDESADFYPEDERRHEDLPGQNYVMIELGQNILSQDALFDRMALGLDGRTMAKEAGPEPEYWLQDAPTIPEAEMARGTNERSGHCRGRACSKS